MKQLGNYFAQAFAYYQLYFETQYTTIVTNSNHFFLLIFIIKFRF